MHIQTEIDGQSLQGHGARIEALGLEDHGTLEKERLVHRIDEGGDTAVDRQRMQLQALDQQEELDARTDRHIPGEDGKMSEPCDCATRASDKP